MKKIILALPLFLLCLLANSQDNQNNQDTSEYPYWILMMQDRSINFYSTQSAFEKYWENRTVTKSSGWKQFKRWEWMALQIIDVQGNFPDEEAQYKNLMQMINGDEPDFDIFNIGSANCNNQGNWKELGPVYLPQNNTGQINGMGRLNAVALHPTDTNTFYVGAAAGGFWKSHDGGKTWAVYKDSLPTLGVSSIAVHPTNTDTIYFGSGDRDNGDASGFGVFRSTDGGNTWKISNSGMGNQTVGKLRIDPSKPSTLIAATHNGIYRSTNSGGTWTRVNTNANFIDVAFMPNNSNIVYACRVGLFYRSTDNGVNWTQITSGLPSSGITRGVLAVSPLDSTLVYLWLANNSVNAGVYLSKDGGANFLMMSDTPNIHSNQFDASGTSGQAWYDKTMTVDPNDAGVIYCGGVNIFRSDDSGKTWTQAGYWVNQIHADHHDMVSCPITKRVFSANDGGLYYTRTKGTPWIPVKSGLAIAQIYQLGASRTQKDILITGFQDNGTGNYNPDNNWVTTRGGDGMDCAVDQEDNRYSYGELYFGQIFRIFNVNTQATIAGNGINGINETGAWNTPFVLREGNGQTMYVGYKNIWRSTNIRSNPPTWTKISNNLGGVSNSNFHAIENCIANSNILYASRSNNTFYRSDNVNDTTPSWTSITQPVAGLVRTIETDPKNENIVYIAISNRVYKSFNKGGSWSQVGGNLPFNVNSILLDTSSIKKALYIGTFGGGVWHIDSTKSSWIYFNNGIPPTSRVTDIELFYDSAKDCNCNILYASTYNRGAWYGNVYQDSTRKPIAKLERIADKYYLPCSNTGITFKSNTCNNPTAFEWTFSKPVTYTNETDSLTENPSISFSQPGIYTYRFIAANCIGSDTIFGQFEALDTARNFCQPTNTVSGNFGIGIFNFEINGMSFTSGGTFNEGSYVDQSCKGLIRLKPGVTYPVRITTGTLNDEQVKIYIDFDNNGVLNQSNELVITPARALTTHIDSFTVPNNAKLGIPLRLRVRSDFFALSSDPCANLSYGQTEDYVVIIESDSFFPNFYANANQACAGNSITFFDSSKFSGGTYVWNFGAGASPATANTPGPHNVSYSTSGYKKITLKVGNEEIEKDSFVLIDAKPSANLSLYLGDSSVCPGGKIGFEATTNAGSPTFVWKRNGATIADSTQKFFHRNNVSASDSGIYSVIISANGCSDSAVSNKIRVRPQPTVNFTINNNDQCLLGNSFSFTNTSNVSSGTISHQWNFGDNTNSSTASPNKSYSGKGNYGVKLVTTSNFGCKDSITKSVSVRPQPSANFTINNSDQCLSGNSFTFTNSSTIDSGSMSHNWSFGDATTSSANSPNKSYSSANSFDVRLVASSSFGCSDTITKSLVVRPQPTVNFTINNNDQCLLGNSFSFTNTSNVSSGTISHQWNFGDNTSSSTASPNKSYSGKGNYGVKLVTTSNFGCKDSITKSVSVRPQPSANFTINNSDQCLSGNSFTFTNSSTIDSGSMSHNWSFGDATTSSANSPNKSYSSANSFDVRLFASSSFGCSDTITKSLVVRPQPTVNFTINNNDQCLLGNSFSFTNTSNVSSGTISHQWNFGDNTNSSTASPNKSYSGKGNYGVKLVTTSNFGCKDSITKSVSVRPQPSANFTINNSDQCLSGNSFTFTNSSTIDSGSMSHNWSFGDATTSSANSPNKSYSSANAFDVRLVASSSFGCSDSITKSLVVRPQPTVNFTINNNDQCLLGNSFSFTNTSNVSSGTISHQWNFGDNTSSGDASPNKTYSADGSFFVKLISSSTFGCKDSISKTLDVRPQPVADFQINNIEQCLSGNDFVFSNTSSISSGNMNHSWNFGDGNNSSNISPNNNYQNPGSYTVTLLSTSTFGCKDSLEKNVQVRSQPDFTLQSFDTICLNDIVDFTSNSSDNSLTYIWKKLGDNDVTGGTYSVSTGLTGMYDVWLIASTPFNCMDSILKSYEINSLPEFSLGSDTNYCENESFFMVLSTGFQAFDNNWNGVAGTDTLHVFEEGAYTALVKDNFGCKFSDEIEITTRQAPVVDLGSDRLLNPDLSVNETLDAGSGFTSYLWNNSSQNQTIVATDTGSYFVRVSNSENCFANDTIQVSYWNSNLGLLPTKTESKVNVYPNPTSTFINIISENQEIVEVRIYDAAGKMVWNNYTPQNSYQISVERWASGVYSIQIVLPNETKVVRQVILR